jgi:hypothetical protein
VTDPAATFDADARAAYLEHLRGGMQLGAAAYVLKVPRAEVEGALAEDADFAMAAREAEATATEHVQEAVYQAAVSGNIQAAKLWFAIQGRLPGRTGAPRGTAPTPPDPEDPELGAALGDLS